MEAGEVTRQFAVVTGASSGIGFELARVLAENDFDLLIIAEGEKLVLRDMVERDDGRILFTSSVASAMPGSFQAAYNASKSFVQSFALAIREELDDTGITVTSLMPGPTETEFFERADMEDTKIGASDGKDDPAEVAREGFEALMSGEAKVVAGSFMNKVQASVAGRVLPDGVKAEMHRRMAEPGSADGSGGS